MNDLTNFSSEMTMSSREIAELCEKRHPDVKRDIEKMLSDIGIEDVSKFAHIYQDTRNREQTEYLLPKDLTMTLVTGYRADLRFKVIKRLEQLEEQQVPQITYVESLRLLADTIEERDKAIATKAEIGSKREATAMATASAATRKAHKLQVALDQSMQYSTIKRMEKKTGLKFSFHKLKKASEKVGREVIKVPDPNFDAVNSYHNDAWLEAYGIEVSGELIAAE